MRTGPSAPRSWSIYVWKPKPSSRPTPTASTEPECSHSEKIMSNIGKRGQLIAARLNKQFNYAKRPTFDRPGLKYCTARLNEDLFPDCGFSIPKNRSCTTTSLRPLKKSRKRPCRFTWRTFMSPSSKAYGTTTWKSSARRSPQDSSNAAQISVSQD